MLLPNSYEAFNGNYRCIYYSQFVVAGEKSESAKQKGYGIGHINTLTITTTTTTTTK